MTGRRRTGERLGAAAVVAVLGVVPGCNSDPVEPESGTDQLLLSAADVGGTEVADVETRITTSSPCGLDVAGQWTGADDTNTNAYQRTVDGVTEEVLIGAVERSRSYALAALRSLRQRITSPECSDGESDPSGDSWTAQPLDGFGPDTVAFRSVVILGSRPATSTEDAAAAGRHSYLRAYRYVAGRMVMVWMERRGDSDPSIDELRSLLDAQSKALTSAAA